MNYVPRGAGEVVIEVPDYPSVLANRRSYPYPNSNSFPHTARPTVPLLSQLSVRAPQQSNSFYNALCRQDTWNYIGLVLVTIASVFVGQFVYNHWIGLLFGVLLILVGTYTAKCLTAVTLTRMGGEKIRVGQLLPIYIAGGLGLFLIGVFTPISLISSWLLLMPSIEPLEAFNVLYTNIVVANFVQLLSHMTLCTILVLPIRRIRSLNIAITLEAVIRLYLLFPGYFCWMTYLVSIESLILKVILITPYVLFSVIGILIIIFNNYLLLSFWFKRWITFGSAASHVIAEEAGGICAVCLESYQHPIKLNVCSHVFCEECIKLWVLRQPTCPLCRLPVTA